MPFLPIADDNPLRMIPFQAVTVGIIALNALIYLWQSTLGEEALWQLWLGYGMIPAVADGQLAMPEPFYRIPAWGTFVTSLFLHSGFWHVAGNMLFLWVFGDNVEDATGHVRFALFFLACGVAGGLAEMAMAPQSTIPVIGASGAIAGVLGAYLLLHPRRRMLILVFKVVPLRLHVGLVLVFWVLFQIGGGILANGDPDNDVAWWSHVGGFLAGMVLIVVLRRRAVPLFDRASPNQDEEAEV
jgi:membrane associated rhomboid family serine protease